MDPVTVIAVAGHLTLSASASKYAGLVIAPAWDKLRKLLKQHLEKESKPEDLQPEHLAIVDELYEASRAGVRIDLIVRGICCLRPEVPGLSDNIRVMSIVDRFLEHARIFYFENGGELEYLLASADWMPRNLDRRVEIAFPVLALGLQAQVREVLEIQLADTVKARRILPDGTSVPIAAESRPALRSQERLYEVTGAHGMFSQPSETLHA